jgi:hypothetical protein
MKINLLGRSAAVMILLGLSLNGPGARAQVNAAAPGGMNAALARLFGKVTAFTATVDARVIDPSQKDSVRMPMHFADLDGKMRIEIDLTQVQSKALSAQQLQAMEQAGLRTLVSIIRPDKKTSYILYPGVQNYSVVPMPKTEAEALSKRLAIDTTALGRETVDGHRCVKNRVVVKDDAKVILEATTWNATDLKNFPVRIETKDQGSTSILSFRQIQFERPDAKLFEVPDGYKENP